MKADVTYRDLVSAIERLEGKIDQVYVTKREFEPVKNIVYGMVGLILIAVLGAFILSRIQVISFGHYSINKLTKRL